MSAAVVQEVVQLLEREAQSDEERERRQAVAAAALMVECARVSPEYEPEERRAIAAGVRKLFDLPPEVADMLVEVAEEHAAEGWRESLFTGAIRHGFDHPTRKELVKLLCDVAYADGVFHLREAAFIRRIARDLGVSEDVVSAPVVRVAHPN